MHSVKHSGATALIIWQKCLEFCEEKLLQSISYFGPGPALLINAASITKASCITRTPTHVTSALEWCVPIVRD